LNPSAHNEKKTSNTTDADIIVVVQRLKTGVDFFCCTNPVEHAVIFSQSISI
jgi:hypothetical protein